MSSHLDDATLEALAHERADLAAPDACAHLGQCAECTELLAQVRLVSRLTAHALVAATPQVVDLEALVAAAMAPVPSVRVPPRPSRRAIAVGTLVAAPLAVVFGVASIGSGTGAGALALGARDAASFTLALVRLVVVHPTPAVGSALGAAGALLATLLVLAIRALIGGPGRHRRALEVTQ